jgi:hypothetical protein
MPFTFSHPAIVLPLATLRRQWISATGLIIGSMTPDFEYFIRMKVQSDYSHTLPGLLWFDIPLGVLLCFVYHNIVRNSFIGNSPNFLKKRLAVYTAFNWDNYFSEYWFVVCISILIGSLSHLLWDSFTHETGFFVLRLPFLRNSVQLSEFTIPLYKLIQHCSSLVGGSIIIIALLSLKKYSIIDKSEIYNYWVLIVIITLTVIILRFVFGLNYNQYGNLIVTAISGGLIALIVAPLALRRV